MDSYTQRIIDDTERLLRPDDSAPVTLPSGSLRSLIAALTSPDFEGEYGMDEDDFRAEGRDDVYTALDNSITDGTVKSMAGLKKWLKAKMDSE